MCTRSGDVCFKQPRSAAASQPRGSEPWRARLSSAWAWAGLLCVYELWTGILNAIACRRFQAPSHHRCHALLASPGPVLLVVEKLTIPLTRAACLSRGSSSALAPSSVPTSPKPAPLHLRRPSTQPAFPLILQLNLDVNSYHYPLHTPLPARPLLHRCLAVLHVAASDSPSPSRT